MPITTLKEWLRQCLPEWCVRKIRSLRAGSCVRGQGSFIHRSVQMLGAANVRIGDNTCIGEQAWFNVNHRRPGAVAIDIGSHCFIGRRNFFSAGQLIRFGDYVLTANDCRFAGSSHIVTDPAIPYAVAGTTDTDTITVGANCFIGAGASIVGNVDIGHGSVIGAAAVVTRDVPPFSLVVGFPASVIKRYSFSRKAWLDQEEVTPADLEGNPDESAYVQMLHKAYPHIDLPVVAAGADLGNL